MDLTEKVNLMRSKGKTEEDIAIFLENPSQNYDPVEFDFKNTDSKSSNWGETVEYVNTYEDDAGHGRGSFKPKKQKFTYSPIYGKFPLLDEVGEESFSKLKGKKVVQTFNNLLKEDGYNFIYNSRATEKAVEATKAMALTPVKTSFMGALSDKRAQNEVIDAEAPNGEKITFIAQEDGSFDQTEINDWINANSLSKDGSREMEFNKFQTKNFFQKEIENSFNKVLKDYDYGGISADEISSFESFEVKKGDKLINIKDDLVKKYKEKYGIEIPMSSYMMEDLFKKVYDDKKNTQKLKSTKLYNELYDSIKLDGYDMYEKLVDGYKNRKDMGGGSYLNFNWDQIVKFNNTEDATKNSIKDNALIEKVEIFRGLQEKITEYEESDNFDGSNKDYLSNLKKIENSKKFIDSAMEDRGETMYIDFKTGLQVDQDFVDDGSENDALKYQQFDGTDQLKNYKQNIQEDAAARDWTVDDWKKAYEEFAVSKTVFNSHNQSNLVSFKYNPMWDVNSTSFTGFKRTMERLGYHYNSGSKRDIDQGKGYGKSSPNMVGVRIQDVLDNWGYFSPYMDDAFYNKSDVEKKSGFKRSSFLGREITENYGNYIKQLKDMSIDNVVKTRAWNDTYRMNIDPSSMKRSKGDLFWKGIVEALPWQGKYSFRNTTTEYFSKDNDSKIKGATELINNVNKDFASKNIKEIKITKKHTENITRSFAEDLTYQAGGFVPMLAEFAVVGGVVNSALKIGRFGAWLNKIAKPTYVHRSGKVFSADAVATRSAAQGFTDPKKWGALNGLSYNANYWGRTMHLGTHLLIEEGKMAALDPLFGTDMPVGMGAGFYLGGRFSKMGFQFGTKTSMAGQTVSRMINPIWNKAVKPGITGAIAAEVAHPFEWMFDSKSLQRHMEETYPDFDTSAKRFATNMILFGAIGMKSMNKVDLVHTVGFGGYYARSWGNKARKFQDALYNSSTGKPKRAPNKSGRTVDGKKYTKDQLEKQYEKYGELASKANQYKLVSENAPQYFNPAKVKKHLTELAKYHPANQKGGKKTFNLNFIESGRGLRKKLSKDKKGNEFYKTTDAYVIDGKDTKNGVTQIWVDPRKITNGQFPHEVYHALVNKAFENTGPEGTEAKLDAAIENHIQKTINKSMRSDLDFMKFINENYDRTESKNIGEVAANLIELLNTPNGKRMFISNNLFGDIAFELGKVTEKMFVNKKGEVQGGLAGKFLVPKLDIKDPKTLIRFLARLNPGKSYNPNMFKRLEKAFEGISLEADGKLYKKGVIVSASAGIVRKQEQIRDSLNPLIRDYNAGRISKAEFLERSGPLVKMLRDIREDEAKREMEEAPAVFKRSMSKEGKKLDETNGERKIRINSNYYNFKNDINPVEGIELNAKEKNTKADYVFDIIESYRSLIVRAGQGKFDTPTYENMSLKQKQQYVFENTQLELIKHIERFKESEQKLIEDKTGEITGFEPKKGEPGKEYVDFDAYINAYVGKKEGTATKKVSKESFSYDIEKAKNVVVEPDVFESVDFGKFENGLVLKDVLDFSKFPDAVKVIKTAGQEKIDKIKSKGDKFYSKFLEREAGKLTGYTYRDIVDVVPNLVKELVSPKKAIDKVQENQKEKKKLAEQGFKNGIVTENRLKEIKAENTMSKSDIELFLQAKYIVDNIEAVRTAASSNVSPMTGKWTGLPSVMMTRKLPSGEKVQVLYEPSKRVSAEKTTKKLSSEGLKKGGNTAGNTKQTKKKLTDIEYLDVLGIKENIDGSIDVSKALSDRGLKETLIPKVLGEVTKALENQIMNDLVETLKADASVKALQNLKRIQTKMRAGKDPGMASAGIGEKAFAVFKQIVYTNPNKSSDYHIQSFYDFDASYSKLFPHAELTKGTKTSETMPQTKEAILELEKVVGKFDRTFKGDGPGLRVKEGVFQIFDGFGPRSKNNVADQVFKQAELKGYDVSKINIKEDLTLRYEKDYSSEFRPFKNRITRMVDPVLLNNSLFTQAYTKTFGEGDGKSIKKSLEKNGQVDLIRAELMQKDVIDNKEGGEGTFDKFIKSNPEYKAMFKNSKQVLDHYKPNKNEDVMKDLHFELGKDVFSKINENSKEGSRQRLLLAKNMRNKLSAKSNYSKSKMATRIVLDYFVNTVDKAFNNMVAEGRPEAAINMATMLYQIQSSASGGLIRTSAFHNAITTQRAINLSERLKRGVEIGENEFRGTIEDVLTEGYRSEHEFQNANFTGNMLISHITGKFKAVSPAVIDVFGQSIIPRYVQKIIDKDGNTTNVYDLPGMGNLKINPKSNFFIDNKVMETTIDVESGRTYAEISNSKFNDLVMYQNLVKLSKSTNILPTKGLSKTKVVENLYNLEKALNNGRKLNKKKRGMSTFDFDETVGFSENFVFATKGKTKKKIASNEWPFVGDKLLAEGWKMDFTDFNKVTDGKPGPLMQKMKNQIKKFGPENVFILTARAPESQKAIYDYLISEGIKIPVKNITGLGNSTGEAKAMWMLEKFSEGYNDMYFVDDALPNVKAVKDVLSQLDIKSKVQIVKASENISKKFNEILFEVKGVEAYKTYSEAKAKELGRSKNKYKFFGTPGSEDFSGLVTYAFAGKGKKGEGHKKFFEEKLHNPYNRAFMGIHKLKQSISLDYKTLAKTLPKVYKSLNNKIPESVYTYDQAIRVDRFVRAGFEIPGLSKKDKAKLLDVVSKDADLQSFATKLSEITRLPEGYIKPKDYWLAESITSDLNNVVDRVYRKEALTEFRENREAIFGKWKGGELIGENMNKIEALYGVKHRKAIEDMLWRMENFTNRSHGTDPNTAKWMNWVNNASSAIMFFNQKSAMLQTISNVNYINGKENNPFAAAKAFGNQKQYWKDFMTIMNSDMLVQRRAGLKINVEAAEIVERVAGGKNTAGRALSVLLEKGFIPTKYADSFAISMGGATYYRNRVEMYKKQGMSIKEAESKSWEDFSMLTEKTQQSSRPDLVSQQQASALGRPILSFANTPMQMFRRHKRRLQDIGNNRGSMAENVLSSVYYGAVQTMIFSYFSNALFSIDSSEEAKYYASEKEQNRAEKIEQRYVQTIVDSYLRGMGTGGATVSAIKNSILTTLAQSEKSNPKYFKAVIDLLNVSPPIGSKVRKLSSAGETFQYNKGSIDAMPWYDINNPGVYATAQVISALTNAPTDRLVLKALNIQDASNNDFENWQRISLLGGFNKWNLGLENDEVNFYNKTNRKSRKKKVKIENQGI